MFSANYKYVLKIYLSYGFFENEKNLFSFFFKNENNLPK